jgi:hypothetical protein
MTKRYEDYVYSTDPSHHMRNFPHTLYPGRTHTIAVSPRATELVLECGTCGTIVKYPGKWAVRANGSITEEEPNAQR